MTDKIRDAAFAQIMSDVTMPDTLAPEYDEWLFDKTWQAALQSRPAWPGDEYNRGWSDGYNKGLEVEPNLPSEEEAVEVMIRALSADGYLTDGFYGKNLRIVLSKAYRALMAAQNNPASPSCSNPQGRASETVSMNQHAAPVDAQDGGGECMYCLQGYSRFCECGDTPIDRAAQMTTPLDGGIRQPREATASEDMPPAHGTGLSNSSRGGQTINTTDARERAIVVPGTGTSPAKGE